MKRNKIINLLILALLSVAVCFSGCSRDVENNDDTSFSYPFEIIKSTEKVEAQIELENGDVIELELYPEIAPVTVSNFKYLADKGFYDGLIFHRVIEGFMIQGGCPDGNGRGNPGYSIKGEFSSNGVKNNLKHERGVISMARSSISYDSAGSQFFIIHQSSPHLDGDYAAFGRVTKGIEAVDKIAAVETDESDRPVKDVIIKTITVK